MNKYWKLVLIVDLALVAAEIPQVSHPNWWSVPAVILALIAAICIAISLLDDWEA